MTTRTPALVLSLLLVLNTAVYAQNSCREQLQQNAGPGFVVDGSGTIRLQVADGSTTAGKVLNPVANLLKNPLGINRIEVAVKTLLADKSDRPYFQKLAEAMRLKLPKIENQLAHIPRTGPLVVVSNHPLNGIDGIANAALLNTVRQDVKVVMLSALGSFPGLKENAIFVMAARGPEAKAYNAKSRQEIKEHLENGGALVIFSAGGVSGKKNPKTDEFAVDADWKPGMADMARDIPTLQIVPWFIEGSPSSTYLSARNFNAALGMPYNIREVANNMGMDIDVTVGPALRPEFLNRWMNRENPAVPVVDAGNMMQFLRSYVYFMAEIKTQKERGLDPSALSMALMKRFMLKSAGQAIPGSLTPKLVRMTPEDFAKLEAGLRTIEDVQMLQQQISRP